LISDSDENEYVEEPIFNELWDAITDLLGEDPEWSFDTEELYNLLIEKPSFVVLAFLLRAQGYTQQDIARQLRVSQSTVKRWFNNQLKDVRDYLIRTLGLDEPFKEKDFKHKRGRPPKYQIREIPGVSKTDEWLEGYQFAKK